LVSLLPTKKARGSLVKKPCLGGAFLVDKNFWNEFF